MSKKLFLFFVVAIHLSACNGIMRVQQKELYDIVPSSASNEINGFKAIYIFNDVFDKSVWVSPEAQCVTMFLEDKNVYANKSSLHVKWDKVQGGCKWIGIGFGWNNWVAKNMIDIEDDCAVQMQVKAVNGAFNNFPVAFAFEDYNGVQAYYGYEKTLSTGKFNDSTWTSVTIPLSKFNFKGKDFNVESVKQFLIQLEGDGDIYLDDIKFVKL
jgi:hypothetical protein